MKIDAERCIGCRTCLDYCNVGAISMQDKIAVIDPEVCVECWLCFRNRVCPEDCIETTPLETPGEMFKHILSDPTETSAGTGIPGRGTEEAKTNDVTGRFDKDSYGICIDMGRPGVGAYMRDVEKVAMAVAAAGVRFASPKETPLSGLMTDVRTGQLRDEYRDVHVLSVIVEGTCRRERFPQALQAILEVANEIDTVFSLGIVSYQRDDRDEPLFRALAENGLSRPTRGKVNVGLGKPLYVG
jgi:NAD-dependent dihydropyrimidine dehydrogenase PreA subunit